MMSSKEKYGQIHVSVRELVLDRFGLDTWQKILEESKLDENEHFMVFHRYPDSQTFTLIGSVSAVLGVSAAEVLEVFGEHFFRYCLKHGYDKMLRALGGDLPSFIQNLDSLHSMLAMSYKEIEAPSFRCEIKDDGTLYLHYYTIRPGIHPIVKGLIRAVSRDLFHTAAELEVVEIKKAYVTGTQEQEHVIFKINFTDEKENARMMLAVNQPKLNALNPSNLHISANYFCAIFPYHVIFDKSLTIRQCGLMVQKLCPGLLRDGCRMADVFDLINPRMEMSFGNFLTFINANFVLELKNARVGESTISVKGQMIWLEDAGHMIYICSPRLASLTELLEKNVFLSDIPIYDATRELVLLNQLRIAEIEISKKLDETTVALKRTSKALDEEKQKTDMLLYQMLPVKVANLLRDGKPVEAEKFEEVTILFSDIVTFTNIAAECAPLQIVDMLNSLYQLFDSLTTKHSVYKVETIGDAYMVVCGVPERNETHAQKVSDFALDMVEEAGKVVSPVTGKPIQIRVGVHTGPVVAGVVGVKMPRYCLFGDTVNTASRMESHGIAGRIHVSPFTWEKLFDSNYKFLKRGETDIKGKGRMVTYFLIGCGDRMLKDSSAEDNMEPAIPTVTVTSVSQSEFIPSADPNLQLNGSNKDKVNFTLESKSNQSPVDASNDRPSVKSVTSSTCIIT